MHSSTETESIMRMPRALAALLAVGLAVGLVPLTTVAAHAEDWTGAPDEDVMWRHATLGCEERLNWTGGRIGPCSRAMWDDYLDVLGEMKKRKLPMKPQPLIPDSFDATGDDWDPEMFDEMYPEDDFSEVWQDYDPANPDATPEAREHFDEEIDRKRKNPNPFRPSTSKPREFMINMLGSVLGDSMPDKWRAEQLANQHRYNHSWDGLAAQFGQDPANPNYVGEPDSYEDYVTRRTELEEFGGTNGKKMSAPATKATAFRKGVNTAGGALGALMGLPFSFAIGNGITNILGIDSRGLVCGSVGDDVVGDLLSLVTGNECSSFWNTVEEFVPNEDADGEPVWGSLCASDGKCIELLAEKYVEVRLAYNWSNYHDYCFSVPFSAGNSYRLWYRTASGSGPGKDNPVGPGPIEYAPWGQPVSNVSDTCGDVSGANGYLRIRRVVSGPGGTQVPGSPPWITEMAFSKSVSSPPAGSSPEWTSPVGGDDDPERSLVCTIEASDGHTYTQTSAATYREGSGATASPECPALPDGVRPSHVQVDDSLGNPLYDEDVTDAYADWWDTYPECREGACKLDLIRTVSSYPVSCFDLENECAEWFTDPDKADNYECHYGIHTVDLDECNVYSGVFQPGRISIGAPYADPTTGEWSGGQSSPAEAAEQMNADVQDPDRYRTCLDDGWAELNPVEWVLTPIKCALEWAFVPRPAVVNLEGYEMSQAWEKSPPGVLIGELSGWSFSIDATGCDGFTIELPYLGEQQLFYACDGGGAQLAAMVKPLTTLGVVIPGAIGIISMIGGVIGYSRGGGA